MLEERGYSYALVLPVFSCLSAVAGYILVVVVRWGWKPPENLARSRRVFATSVDAQDGTVYHILQSHDHQKVQLIHRN